LIEIFTLYKPYITLNQPDNEFYVYLSDKIIYKAKKTIKIKQTMKSKEIIVSIIGSLALIFVAFIFSNTYKFKYNRASTINVTGNAKTDFEADVVKWSAQYSRKSSNLSDASAQLKKDKELVREFLGKQGINEDEIRFGSISIDRDYSYKYDKNGNSTTVFLGYDLSQRVSIESKSIDKVDEASRGISSLISQGIELRSYSPEYYFSKLENLKLELISLASENARQRAENIAEKSKAKIDKLVKADLGVFQIIGRNENENYSYGGVFNTSSRYKTANITVKSIYSIK